MDIKTEFLYDGYGRLTFADGIMLISYVYDAWGNTQTTYHNGGSSSNASKKTYTYRGYYYDKDIYFYYLQTRYYDPLYGRFISSADVSTITSGGITGNMFAYANNNPIGVVYSDGVGERVIYVGANSYEILNVTSSYSTVLSAIPQPLKYISKVNDVFSSIAHSAINR